MKGDKKLGPIKNLEAEIIEAWRCWRCHAEKEAQEADEKIPLLLQIPAAGRFISYEPALGPILIKW